MLFSNKKFPDTRIYVFKYVGNILLSKSQMVLFHGTNS